MGAESLFEVTGSYCVDCQTPVTFLGVPSDALCPSCGLHMYLTENGISRHPRTVRAWHPVMGPQDQGRTGRQPKRSRGRRGLTWTT
jgi:hypothetical protein